MASSIPCAPLLQLQCIASLLHPPVDCRRFSSGRHHVTGGVCRGCCCGPRCCWQRQASQMTWRRQQGAIESRDQVVRSAMAFSVHSTWYIGGARP